MEGHLSCAREGISNWTCDSVLLEVDMIRRTKITTYLKAHSSDDRRTKDLLKKGRSQKGRSWKLAGEMAHCRFGN